MYYLDIKRTIGLVGGICAGKTTLCTHLKSKGWVISNLDDIGAEARKTKEVVDQCVMRWGDRVSYVVSLDDPPKLRSDVIASIVFNDEKELRFLERVLEVHIESKLQESLFGYCWEFWEGLILDAPTLMRHKKSPIFSEVVAPSEIWYVDCPFDVRVERFKKRMYLRALSRTPCPKELSTDEAASIIKQREKFLLLNDGKKAANYIIDGNLSKEEVASQVDKLLKPMSIKINSQD